jgi:hypothetical protein
MRMHTKMAILGMMAAPSGLGCLCAARVTDTHGGRYALRFSTPPLPYNRIGEILERRKARRGKIVTP